MISPKGSLEKAVAAQENAQADHYELCLFIAGMTPLSAAALANVVAICDERLEGKYDLTVIDVYQEPERAKREQVIAAPTLIKKHPGPVRRLIGDLSNRAEVLRGLGLKERSVRARSGVIKKRKNEKARQK